jgi:hypothetical protein
MASDEKCGAGAEVIGLDVIRERNCVTNQPISSVKLMQGRKL